MSPSSDSEAESSSSGFSAGRALIKLSTREIESDLLCRKVARKSICQQRKNPHALSCGRAESRVTARSELRKGRVESARVQRAHGNPVEGACTQRDKENLVVGYPFGSIREVLEGESSQGFLEEPRAKSR